VPERSSEVISASLKTFGGYAYCLKIQEGCFFFNVTSIQLHVPVLREIQRICRRNLNLEITRAVVPADYIYTDKGIMTFVSDIILRSSLRVKSICTRNYLVSSLRICA